MAALKIPAVSIGDRFGALVVAGDPIRRPRWAGGPLGWAIPCRCDCGKASEPQWGNLRSGNSTSCPCSRGREAGKFLSKLRRTHGEGHSRLYSVWTGMRHRCLDPKTAGYHRYGGRGITICPEWEASYEAFRDWAHSSGYAEGLTIERKDVNAGYSPGNCTWADMKAQAHNTRRNRHVEAFGESKLLCEWVRDTRCTVDHSTVISRLASGWSPEQAISAPPNTLRKRNGVVS